MARCTWTLRHEPIELCDWVQPPLQISSRRHRGHPPSDYTTAPNLCQGVKDFRETGRNRHVTDNEFEHVKAHAYFTVADATDLALLTGQRPANVLKIKCTDIRDDAPWIVQNKTGALLGIEITGELAVLIDRINARALQAISECLIQDETGHYVSLRRGKRVKPLH